MARTAILQGDGDDIRLVLNQNTVQLFEFR
jgi:hypothetical protein